MSARPAHPPTPGRKRLRLWAGYLGLALGLYLGICVLMYGAQHSLQYHPDSRPMPLPLQRWPQLQALQLQTADGEQLVAWWQAPQRDDAPVYLYLHGNAAQLRQREGRLGLLAADGAGFLALSWRGYGGSSGRPHEAGLLADARSAYQALAERVAPQRIVIFGESLGSTVAVMLAAELADGLDEKVAPPSTTAAADPAGRAALPAALVLDSSFASALDVAQGAYPWLPVRWLLRDPYRADLAAPRVPLPVLQIHCLDDPVTPLASARRLHALLPGRQPLELLPGRCHTPPLQRFQPALQRFIASLPGLR